MSKTLPLLSLGCQVIHVKATSLKEIGTLDRWEFGYLYALVLWPKAGAKRESIFDITTPEDWLRRHEKSQESVANHWQKAGAR